MKKFKVRYLSTYVYETLTSLLILLWVYTAGSQILDFTEFNYQMHSQIFPDAIADILLYIIPAVEFIAAGLLFFYRTRFRGFLLSFSLLLIFTVYMALNLFYIYPNQPCNCAGSLMLFSNIGWPEHLLFNMIFTSIAISGILYATKADSPEHYND